MSVPGDGVLVWNGAVERHAFPAVPPGRDPREPAPAEAAEGRESAAGERRQPTAGRRASATDRPRIRLRASPETTSSLGTTRSAGSELLALAALTQQQV